jgi:hypothetical protein
MKSTIRIRKTYKQEKNNINCTVSTGKNKEKK